MANIPEFHYLESGLLVIVSLLQIILEFISIVCIILGLFFTLKLVIRYPATLKDFPFFKIRLCFGSWLALALEFQLASDIVATTVSPSFPSLGKLGAIALIRTFLNYFLTQELENEQKNSEKF